MNTLSMRVMAALAAVGAPALAAGLRAGAASVKITPPEGAPMSGYYYERAADGVHDDLHAKALVLDDGHGKAALVACDLVSMPRDVAEEARKLIEAQTGIPGGRVMISATHAHTGPVLLGRTSRDKPKGRTGEIAAEYVQKLPGLIAESVKLANANLQPARMSAAVGREDSLAFNRRYFMTDGTVGWNPGKLNPKIIKPAGSIDPDVPVVYVESESGRPLATYVNYAMHLDTVGGTQFSADYAYTLSTLLGKIKSPDMLTLFTIGCAGNVNHVNVKSRDPQKGHGEAARIGTVLAGEVLKTYTRLQPVTGGVINARSEIVPLPLAPVNPGDLPKAEAVAAKYGKPNAAPFLDFVQAFKVIDVSKRDGKPIEAEVQVIALGDELAWVGLPGEIFTELGAAIKQASPYKFTILAELANGSVGYVPDRRAYPQGNYEVVSARMAAGSGEMLVDAAVRLLKQSRNH